MAVALEGHVTAAEAALTLRVPASTLGYMARAGCSSGGDLTIRGWRLMARLKEADIGAIRRQMKRRTSPVASPAVWCHLIRRMLDRQ
jgi:hypothetical protein